MRTNAAAAVAIFAESAAFVVALRDSVVSVTCYVVASVMAVVVTVFAVVPSDAVAWIKAEMKSCY